MKNLIIQCLVFSLLILSADEKKDVQKPVIPNNAIWIIVAPSKSELVKNEEIDVEVFIYNLHFEPIKVPPPNIQDGYSATDVDINYRTFRIKNGELENLSISSSGSSIHELSYPSLEPNKSKRYKFRWKCPDDDFDLLSLKFSFFIEGDLRSGLATFTQKRQ